MDVEILQLIKNCSREYPLYEEYLKKEWDSGFIFFNSTQRDDYIDPFLNSGQYEDYPILNISIGCSSIALFGVFRKSKYNISSEEEAPTTLLLDSGSLLYISKEGASFNRRGIKPYSKSFNLQGLVIQDSVRLMENIDK